MVKKSNWGNCSGCSIFSFIVNKTHYICAKCNENRLGGIRENKPKKSLSQFSTKGRINKQKVDSTYKEMDESSDQLCSGCERTHVITHSHIFPRSFKQYEAEKWNIGYHCIPCHDLWESKDIEQMKKLLDFESRMEVIKTHDENYYNSLLEKTRWQRR